MIEPPRPGWREGALELIERVAEGPFSEVWRGALTQDPTPLPVAVKFARGELGLQMLTTEIQLAQGPLRDCSLAVLASRKSEASGYLAREWFPGGTLRERLDSVRSGSDRGRALQIVLDVIDQVARVHRRRVVHGDLKPENVLLSADDTAQLIDFGLSQHTQALRRDQSLSASLNTSNNPTGGTLAYMAPEVVKGGTPGRAADVYALGILLHEALLGRRPGKGRQSEAQLARLPGGVEAVLNQCLAYEVEDRYGSAFELLEHLRPLQESLVSTGVRRQLQGLKRWVVTGLAAGIVAFRYLSVFLLLSAYAVFAVRLAQSWNKPTGLLLGFAGVGLIALVHVWIGWAGPTAEPSAHPEQRLFR